MIFRMKRELEGLKTSLLTDLQMKEDMLVDVYRLTKRVSALEARPQGNDSSYRVYRMEKDMELLMEYLGVKIEHPSSEHIEAAAKDKIVQVR